MRPKIGLIGCGRWGRFILRDLKNLGCHVQVVARSASGRDNARQHEADQIVGNLDDLDADTDGFVVATPTITHLDVVNQLIGRNRPIYVEKPLTPDIEGAKQLVGLADNIVFIMHKWRYHPGVEALRSIVQTNEYGPVHGLRSKRIQWLSPHNDVDPIWILAPHDLSIATHIFQWVPKPLQAFADPCGPGGSGLTAQLRDEKSDASIVIEVSANGPGWKREISLGCQDALVSICDDDYTTLEIRHWGQEYGESLRIEKRNLDDRMPLLAELEAFVQHVQGGPPPLTCFSEEMQILDVLAELRSLAGIVEQSK